MAHHLRRLLSLALLSSLAACSTTPRGGAKVKNTTKTFTTVVVDAGHGGRDQGADRRYGGREKILTLDLARRLDSKLRESQFNTVMTRTSDVYVPLEQRVDVLNTQKNAVLVSLHFNDARKRDVYGFESYFFSPASKKLAQRIQGNLLTIPKTRDRRVRFGNLQVLRDARYPAVLIECGFLSNRNEGRRVRDAKYRELLADRIAEAIVDLRYGSGVYSARAQAVVAPDVPAAESSGPGLPPPIR
jgi:N-acetylmuramoyl-L-alanine amidase